MLHLFVSAGGSFSPKIVSDINGWSLVAGGTVKENDILMTIPKTICISSNAKTTLQPSSPLLESTESLMLSLSPKLWRARLAIAILSERVRAHSPFLPYIRNLPHIYRVSDSFCLLSIRIFVLLQFMLLCRKYREIQYSTPAMNSSKCNSYYFICICMFCS